MLKTAAVVHNVQVFNLINFSNIFLETGAPRGDPGLQRPEQHQPFHPDQHVCVQRHLLPGHPVLLLHSPRGEKQQKRLQAFSLEPKKSHLQHVRDLK